MSITTAPETVTLTLTQDEAFLLACFCSDAASVWFDLWKDASEGRRTDLDADTCISLNQKAWEMHRKIQPIKSGI